MGRRFFRLGIFHTKKMLGGIFSKDLCCFKLFNNSERLFSSDLFCKNRELIKLGIYEGNLCVDEKRF